MNRAKTEYTQLSFDFESNAQVKEPEPLVRVYRNEEPETSHSSGSIRFVFETAHPRAAQIIGAMYKDVEDPYRSADIVRELLSQQPPISVRLVASTIDTMIKDLKDPETTILPAMFRY